VSQLTALDVVIGLVFVYFVLSLACSALNETMAAAFGWRAKTLEMGIRNLLVDPDDRQQGEDVVRRLYRHPLVRPLTMPVSGRRKRKRKPSYIPARTFASAILRPVVQHGDELVVDARGAAAVVKDMPESEAKRALLALLADAGGDLERFRHSVETWYDDAMGRVSGWYRRRIGKWLWFWAIVLVLALNADTIQIARTLWTDAPVRAAVVAEAQRAADQGQAATAADASNLQQVAGNVQDLQSLRVPLGWSLRAHDPQEIPRSFDDLTTKVLGLLLTALALTVGAPFWFDVLNRIAHIRSTGSPPAPPSRDPPPAAAASGGDETLTDGGDG
jgi:hypothetical protein